MFAHLPSAAGSLRSLPTDPSAGAAHACGTPHLPDPAPVVGVPEPEADGVRTRLVEIAGREGTLHSSEFRSPGPQEQGTQTRMADAHCHPGPGYSFVQVHDADQRFEVGLARQIACMDRAGVSHMLCMGIPTKVLGGPDACCGEAGPQSGMTYYMPDRFRRDAVPAPEELERMGAERQYYDLSTDWLLALAHSRLPERLRQRLHLSVTGINPADSNSPFAILRLKTEYPGAFCWAGEWTRRKEAVSSQNRDYQPGNADDDAAFDVTLDFLDRAGMGLTLHSDVSDAGACLRTGQPGGAQYLDEMTQLLERHPRNVICWAHFGGLGRFGPPPPGHERILRELLTRFPNLYIDISWDAVAEHYSPRARPAQSLHGEHRERYDAAADARERQARIRSMADLINEFGDRFLFGSDALVPRREQALTSGYAVLSGWGPQVRGGTAPAENPGEALFDHLRPEILQRVLHRNFEQLFAAVSAQARDYEQQRMPADLRRAQAQARRHGATPNPWRW